MPRPANLVPALFVAATLSVGSTGVAHAHIAMSSPRPRTTQQKRGPCGADGLARGETVAVYEPGETIVIRWTETVDHTSHYRIAFDVDGDDDFVPPADRNDLYNSPAVLVDGIEDMDRNNYAQTITLPDVECERCTIQLIQMMHGSGNYFQCADIAIRRSGEPPPTVSDAGTAADAGPPEDGGVDYTDAGLGMGPGPGSEPRGRVDALRGTCSAGPTGGGSAPWVLLATLAGLSTVRRRRR